MGDPQLRGLHAQLLGLQEQMQKLRVQMMARRQELLGEEGAAMSPSHPGRHAMHLRSLGGGRDMGMGAQGLRGRGMMGRTMMRGGMMGRGAAQGTDPRWCPSGSGRGMCRGMARQGAAGR